MVLGQIVVNSSNLLTLVLVFSFSVGLELSESLELIEVLESLLLLLVQLVGEVVDVLSDLVAIVGLLGDVSLSGGDFELLPVDLVTVTRDLSLIVRVDSALLVKEESEVIDFLLEGENRHCVGFMLSSVLVVLQQLPCQRSISYLLILLVSVLALDVVKLVSQSQIVLVSLLDLKDLSLQLRNQQVLLVAS